MANVLLITGEACGSQDDLRRLANGGKEVEFWQGSIDESARMDTMIIRDLDISYSL
jgi:hypothetical protein